MNGSTNYEHFSSSEELYRQSLKLFLKLLATRTLEILLKSSLLSMCLTRLVAHFVSSFLTR